MNKKYNYDEILERFFAKEQVGKYSLKNIRKACTYFGNPQESFKSIHIAGTNGKGSVAKMMFQILKEDGKKVGVYTSPHLFDIRERFETENGIISKDLFVEYAHIVLDYNEVLSYFEKCVLLAFLYFRDIGCEYVIIETGLGGRLDATNIITPELSIITSIGYDHMEYLGNTLEEISFEKAGIIKENIPLILYGENATIESIAKQRNAPISYPKKEKIETNLAGKHQVHNAQIAYKGGENLGVEKTTIIHALQNVTHRARLEYIQKNILIDGAHNKNGIEMLQKYLEEVSHKWDTIIYCFALKKGKTCKDIFCFFPYIENWNTLKHNSPLLEPHNILMQQGHKNGKNMSCISVKDIMRQAQEKPKNLFVVFGSLYALGDFL